jgi:hypothetical protein
MMGKTERHPGAASASQRKRARRRARTGVREDKGKGKEDIREPGTGANTMPMTPRTILKRPETTRWEKAELMKR